MSKTFRALALGLVASAALAQSPCFDSNYGIGIGNGDDVTLPLQAIGFAFPFGGATYTDFYTSTNGFIYLRNGAAATLPGALCCTGVAATMLANTVGPMICPFWTDLNVSTANGGQVHVNSTASVCTITWFNTVEFGEATNTKFHLQLKLHASGQIDCTYTSNVLMRTTGDCIVGVTPGNGAANPGASDLSIGGTSTGDTLFEIFNNTALQCDLAGRTLTLLSTGPTTPGSPINYVTAACPLAYAPAFNTSYGTGCVTLADQSFYELFASSAAFDLSNSAMTFLNAGTSYLTLPGTTTFVAPSGSATTLALGDDTAVTVPLSGLMPYGRSGLTGALTVCSNGFVSAAAGNTTTFTPSVATFLNSPQTAWWCWHDYNPSITTAGAGRVKFEEIAGVAYVTWDAVWDYSGTTAANANTFQFQFEIATGSVHFVWQTMSALGNARLVGFSEGGASADPGSIDISAMLPSTITGSYGLLPLGLTATGMASPGGTVTLSSTNVPAGSPFGIVIFGLVQFNPPVSLDSIGMVGCFQYNEAAATVLFLAPATGVNFTAPTGTAFLGVNVEAQSAVVAPGVTTLGWISSNGIRVTLGT